MCVGGVLRYYGRHATACAAVHRIMSTTAQDGSNWSTRLEYLDDVPKSKKSGKFRKGMSSGNAYFKWFVQVR